MKHHVGYNETGSGFTIILNFKIFLEFLRFSYLLTKEKLKILS